MNRAHRMSIAIRRALVCTAASLMTLPSHAGWGCQGKVRGLVITSEGTLVMSLYQGDDTPIWDAKYICSVSTPANGIDPQACKSIYGLLVTSIALGRTVTFWFDYNNAQSPSCTPTRFPAWTWLPTGSANWYHGPQLDGS